MSPDEPQTTPSPPQPGPRRRWWSLSVRGLMILVLVIGSLIGWRASQVARMRRAVAVLVRNPNDPPDYRPAETTSSTISGSPTRTEVTYNDEYSNGEFQDFPRPVWLHQGLRRALGDDYFRGVSGLKLSRPPLAADWDAIEALGSVEQLKIGYLSLSNENMDRLANCTGLRELSLNGSKLPARRLASVGVLRNLRVLDLWGSDATADDLAPLANLSRLEKLQLPAAAGTDAGLRHIHSLENLQNLDDWGNTEGGVTDVGLSYLRGMTQLRHLSFNAHHVTDEGMAVLEALPRLDRLEIRPAWLDIAGALTLSQAAVEHLDRFTHLTTLKLATQVTIDDTWLAAIGRLAGLRELDIAGDGITDAGLAHLAKLTQLETLTITSQRVTDAGLRQLNPLGRLQSLGLLANVTDAGVASIQAALPKLKYVHNTRWPTADESLLVPAPPFGMPAPRPIAPMKPVRLFHLQAPPAPVANKP